MQQLFCVMSIISCICMKTSFISVVQGTRISSAYKDLFYLFFFLSKWEDLHEQFRKQ